MISGGWWIISTYYKGYRVGISDGDILSPFAGDGERRGVGILAQALLAVAVVDGAGHQLDRHDPAAQGVVQILAPVLVLAVMITEKVEFGYFLSRGITFLHQ